MITDADGWCKPSPGQDVDAFLDEFVASRPPLTGAEIAELRAIFRPALAQLDQRAASEATTDAA
ncbi:hypothetical protein [Streptomyces erythrochromogenes]|uniref:hypothetical protein n=1 Tax=Streptomyces erythrochromogenes TaxID=285574 RepID=UPI00386843C6|nr:hypothetical protein OG364_29465 [Streptomyces erythrochromogenes]